MILSGARRVPYHLHINWIRFTTWLSAQIINETITKLTGDERVNVLIIDNTLFDRSSSKKVELLAKVYDHAKKAYKKGFRLLTLGWSDKLSIAAEQLDLLFEAFMAALPEELKGKLPLCA